MSTSYKEDKIKYKAMRADTEDGEVDAPVRKKKKKQKAKKSNHKHNYRNIVLYDSEHKTWRVDGACAICGHLHNGPVKDEPFAQAQKEFYVSPVGTIITSNNNEIFEFFKQYYPVVECKDNYSGMFPKEIDLEGIEWINTLPES